jgi:hypothetical protein
VVRLAPTPGAAAAEVGEIETNHLGGGQIR